MNRYCGQKLYKPVYRVASQLKKLVNMGGGGVECEEIKLAGVRAELGNILLTYLCKYIQYKVAGRGCKTRIIDRLVELRLCKIRSIIGLESESVLFSMLDIFNGAIFLAFSMLDIFNGAITFTFYRLS